MKFTDHLNRTIELKSKPTRIVSLVPSVTETVADLGIKENLVAVTRFCKYPSNVISKLPIIGGPKNIDVNKIVDLHPDLVIAVKEENNKEQVLTLSEKVPVIVFNITSIDDSIDMLRCLGTIFEATEISERFIKAIKKNINDIVTPVVKKKTVYLIWKNPWIAAGKTTFIGSMMRVAGFENIIQGRYPEISGKVLDQADTILLATEPYHFKEIDRKELAGKFPDKEVKVVDGEMFTWYGTHMLQAIDYFQLLR